MHLASELNWARHVEAETVSRREKKSVQSEGD
jgi:hypothetical protein